MNVKQIIYLIFPFAGGLVAQKVMKIPDITYWFYVWLLCIASVFIFVKIILPYHENRFDAVSPIDYKGSMDNKSKDEKFYTYAVGIHMATLVGIIITYFIN